MARNSFTSLFPYLFVVMMLDEGHGWSRTVSDDNYSLLPRCYGLHPHVRYHQRRLFQRCTRLVSAACGTIH